MRLALQEVESTFTSRSDCGNNTEVGDMFILGHFTLHYTLQNFVAKKLRVKLEQKLFGVTGLVKISQKKKKYAGKLARLTVATCIELWLFPTMFDFFLTAFGGYGLQCTNQSKELWSVGVTVITKMKVESPASLCNDQPVSR